jgi:hypothetical protein
LKHAGIALLSGSLLLGSLLIGSLLLPASASGEEEASCSGVRLVEVAAASGVSFLHRSGATGSKLLPETMGAGLAWLDYDGDGWQDLYLVQSGSFPPAPGEAVINRLFRNLGGRFVEVTEAAAAADPGYGQGVLAADLDGDGWVDLVVTNFGEDVILHNNGRGSFARKSVTKGLETAGWSSSAAAADADGDGDLDLYVSGYLEFDPAAPLFCGDPETGERRYCDPSLFEGARDHFFLNQGDMRWLEAGEEVGLSEAKGRGLGVLFSDLDGDRLPDIYVANDLTPNSLFQNLGEGRFSDVSLFSGAAVDRNGKPEAGMGVAMGDLDRNQRPDLVVTNFDVETNTHYANRGAMSFGDVSATSGLGPPSFNFLSFGIGVADLNLDGALDVYVANGHIFERPNRDNSEYRQRDQVLLGDGGGRFREARCAALDARATVARGLALADYDSDGDIDVALQENNGPAALLRNDAASAPWLGVRLVGVGANSEAVGALVRLETSAGEHIRWVLAGDSYQSSSERRVLFNLGVDNQGVDERPIRLEVTWPSGRRTALGVNRSGSYLTLAEVAARD